MKKAADGVRFPHIRVKLTGQNGNAFMVLGLVKQALKKAGVPDETIAEFNTEATAGDYDHMLMTVMDWVDVS